MLLVVQIQLSALRVVTAAKELTDSPHTPTLPDVAGHVLGGLEGCAASARVQVAALGCLSVLVNCPSEVRAMLGNSAVLLILQAMAVHAMVSFLRRYIYPSIFYLCVLLVNARASLFGHMSARTEFAARECREPSLQLVDPVLLCLVSIIVHTAPVFADNRTFLSALPCASAGLQDVTVTSAACRVLAALCGSAVGRTSVAAHGCAPRLLHALHTYCTRLDVARDCCVALVALMQVAPKLRAQVVSSATVDSCVAAMAIPGASAAAQHATVTFLADLMADSRTVQLLLQAQCLPALATALRHDGEPALTTDVILLLGTLLSAPIHASYHVSEGFSRLFDAVMTRLLASMSDGNAVAQYCGVLATLFAGPLASAWHTRDTAALRCVHVLADAMASYLANGAAPMALGRLVDALTAVLSQQAEGVSLSPLVIQKLQRARQLLATSTAVKLL